MDKKEMKRLGLTGIEELLTDDFGPDGSPTRVAFEADVDAFILGEQLRDERIRAGLTQEQLAQKVGMNKRYISRVENGHANIQVATLFRLFNGLGRRVSLSLL